MIRPLRSTAITAASALLRDGPPLCSRSVLSPSRFPPLGVLPTARPECSRAPGTTGSPVPCKSLDRTRALFMPDTAGPVNRSLPNSSRDRLPLPVLMSP